MMSYIILFVIVAISCLFRQVKRKRRMLSQKARQQYDDIATSINDWAENKDNHERFQLARVALALYDDWYKRSTVLPVTISNSTAEEFAVLTEWRNLIEDSEWAVKNASSGRPSELLEIEYAVNRTALREHCNNLQLQRQSASS